ncbi:hypothetical protein TWF718_010303 [Orbilia javanica]|uniref:Uncharacterized protein n=1 Tax=Orbilia javanica TaxID=47235 RepID=A0AAN8R9Y3_9PEZI
MHASKVIALLVAFVGLTMALPTPVPAPEPEPELVARWKFTDSISKKIGFNKKFGST